jgi:hypothetical protein
MTGKIENTPGLIDQDTGMINDDAGLIENSTGLIEKNSGLIEKNSGLINPDAGLITETDDVENNANGRRKRSRERGKDAKPRDYPLHTMKNLPQFRNKSHEEVRQYILEKKGVDIGSNFNWNNTMVWILVGLVAVAGGIGIVKWWQQRQMKNEIGKHGGNQ